MAATWRTARDVVVAGKGESTARSVADVVVRGGAVSVLCTDKSDGS